VDLRREQLLERVQVLLPPAQRSGWRTASPAGAALATLISGTAVGGTASVLHGAASIAGFRPNMRSTTMRLEPQAMVQPIWPWPVLSQRFWIVLTPMIGGPSGVIGRRQAQ